MNRGRMALSRLEGKRYTSTLEVIADLAAADLMYGGRSRRASEIARRIVLQNALKCSELVGKDADPPTD